MSARSIAYYTRKLAPVVSDVDQAARRDKVEAELREVESAAPVEAKALRFAAHCYHTAKDVVASLEAKAELYRAARVLAKAVGK